MAGLTGLLLLGGGAAYADDPPPPTPTVDCGLPSDGDSGVAVGEPAPGTDPAPDASDTSTATIDPAPGGTEPDGTTPDPMDPGLDPNVICIASAVAPGAPPVDTGGGGEAVVSAPVPQLPRTGPAPLLPTVALGSWLVLLGVVVAAAGRRRTARV